MPEGPLAAHIGPFAESLREQGYAVVSIHKQVLLAACFSRWLKQRRVSLRSITSDHPTRYLRCRARQVRCVEVLHEELRRWVESARVDSVTGEWGSVGRIDDRGKAGESSL